MSELTPDSGISIIMKGKRKGSIMGSRVFLVKDGTGNLVAGKVSIDTLCWEVNPLKLHNDWKSMMEVQRKT